jgi:hypothetical protein
MVYSMLNAVSIEHNSTPIVIEYNNSLLIW